VKDKPGKESVAAEIEKKPSVKRGKKKFAKLIMA